MDGCYELNWTRKYDLNENILKQWKHRNLILMEEVYVIVTFALSKFVLQHIVLTVPNEVKT